MKSEETKTTQGNKLIAEFMNVTLHGNDRNGYWYAGEGVPNPFTSHLGYDTSWDWIMPVIRKINGLGKEYSLAIFKNYVSCTVEKGGKFYKDFSFSHAEYITSEQDDITAAFKLVVKFIEWYNVNVKAKEAELKTNE